MGGTIDMNNLDLKTIIELAKLKRNSPKQYEEMMKHIAAVTEDLFGVFIPVMGKAIKKMEEEFED